MNIFVICPVRNADEAATAEIARWVSRLEAAGNTVHWPARDTNQEDPIGDRICADNRAAIEAADRVALWFDPASQGSLFDIGIAWALRKPVDLLNVVEPTEKKSFANVLLRWAA